MDLAHLALYAAAPLAAVWLYLRRQRRIESGYRVTLSESTEAGLTEPVSLHPVVDPARCLGYADCVNACPESALGIIEGKAQLVNPSACIGHGACAASCEQDAIRLVVGSERRGVDIPHVSPEFETNVRGIFIAGELGGMGLIRKAAEQGRQAMEAIAARVSRARTADAGQYDVVIVGAGPAGLAAALAAKEKGLRFVALEQETTLGGSILHFPRQKIAMTAPMRLPIVGNVNWREVRKEALLEFWTGVMKRTRLPVRFGERVVELRRSAAGFAVRTACAEYRASTVLLSIGRRGSPRKLGVPGEELEKVVYRLADPQQYRGHRVLVVGGGDSAVEATIAIAEQPGAEVALSYRGEAFSRVKPKNRRRLEALAAERRVRILLRSTVTSIEIERVHLRQEKPIAMRNDAVIVCAGGELPMPMLRDIGVMVETHYGTQVAKPVALSCANP
jgi:thioredoxin reductase/NAD-dependent dihydropyrimidine dehydrogenase PreA subunit